MSQPTPHDQLVTDEVLARRSASALAETPAIVSTQKTYRRLAHYGRWVGALAAVAAFSIASLSAVKWFRPTPADQKPIAQVTQMVTPPDRDETYLELDLSDGRGEFTEWLVVPSEDLAELPGGGVRRMCDLAAGDRVQMAESPIALVTKAEKHVPTPRPANEPTPPPGLKYERVVGWVKRPTDTLLYLHTTDELIKTTPEHPFSVEGKGWVKAADLKTGDLLHTAGQGTPVAVVSTEVRNERETVYNLRVEGSNTYFVGKNMLLVHNGGPCVPEIQQALAKKAAHQVRPGIRVLEGQVVDDLGRVQPWRAHYDDFGRLIGRTDFNAGNAAHGIPDVHHHLFEWRHGNPFELPGHFPGEFIP